MLKLRSSDPRTPLLSSWPCAFAAMEVASAVFVIAGTLAVFTGAGFRIALVHIFML